MKLLYLNHNIVGTGTYPRALHLARAMVRRGHEVTLVTTSREGRLTFRQREDDGVVILEAPDLWTGPARTGWDPWNTLRRWLRLRHSTPDLIHAFDGRPVVSVPAWLLGRRTTRFRQLRSPETTHGPAANQQAHATRPVLVMDWADWWGRGGQIQQRSGWAVRTFFGPVETWFEEAFRPSAAAHTVISDALRERAIGLGIDPERVLTLHSGCATERLEAPDRPMARARLGLPAADPLAVHLGVLTPADMALLAAAWRTVLAQRPDARLALVGNPRAPVPADLLDSGSLVLTGFVTDQERNAWLGAADVCLVALPDTIGNRGRWPGKINDYFSAGRATVMTGVGDAAAVVAAHRLGIVTPSSGRAFGGGIRAALDAPEAMAEAGARARALAQTELSWPVIAERLQQFYAMVRQQRLGAAALAVPDGAETEPMLGP